MKRNTSTPESRKFWGAAEQDAVEVAKWPAWKRAGINVHTTPETGREKRRRAKGERRVTIRFDDGSVADRLDELAHELGKTRAETVGWLLERSGA